MDTKDVSMIPECGNLAELAQAQVVVGAKQLKKALNNGTAKSVFLAENADPVITEPLQALCLSKNVRCAWVPTMTDLGIACGIDVGAAAAAVVG